MSVRAHRLLVSRAMKSEVYQSHSADLLATQHTLGADVSQVMGSNIQYVCMAYKCLAVFRHQGQVSNHRRLDQ